MGPAPALLALALATVTAHADGVGARGSDPYGARRTTVDLLRPTADTPRVWVQVELPDGHPGLFMIDTGADVSLLSREAAERLALPIDGREQVEGLGGTAEVDFATLPWLRLGDVTVPDVEVAVGVPGQGEGHGLLPADGLLGNNVWQHFLVELDYRADRLTLTVPRARALARRGPTGRRAMPMRFDGSHVLGDVTLACHGERPVAVPCPTPPIDHTVRLALDTGASGVILLGREPGRGLAGFTEGLEPVYGLGGADWLPPEAFLQRTRRVPLDGVRLGGAEVPVDLEARWLRYGDAAEDIGLSVRGLVGHDAFEDRRLLLDYPRRRIALRRSRRPAAFHDAFAALLAEDEARFGDDVDRWLLRARLHLGRDDRDAARRLLERLVEAAPPALAAPSFEARVWLGRIHRLEGRSDEALEVLGGVPTVELVRHDEIVAAVGDRLLAGRPDQALALAEEAVREVASREGDEAVPPLQAAQAALALSDARLAVGDPSAAAAALAQAADHVGHAEAFPLRRARLAFARDDRDGALALLRTAALDNPLDGRFLFFYADLAEDVEASTLRADLAAVASRVHPSLAPRDFLAWGHHRLGDVEEATRLAQEGLDRTCRGGQEPERLNCRAWYRALAGLALDEALAEIQAALEEAPHRADFLDTLAMVHEARGEGRAARDAAEAAARRMPDDVWSLWQLDRPARSAEPP